MTKWYSRMAITVVSEPAIAIRLYHLVMDGVTGLTGAAPSGKAATA